MSNLENALQCRPELTSAAARGWRLFPVKAHGKEPMIREWQRVATSNLEYLEVWASRFPGCNWGLATGQDSGVFVLDVDGEPGRLALQGYEQEGRVLPDTLTVNTGRGSHRYFKWPKSQDIRNSAGKLAPGLDIRGNGGYVVIPPSVHPSGAVYTYSGPDALIADPPDWLLTLLKKPGPGLVVAGSGAAIREGQRNSALFSRAATMQKSGMASGSILAGLMEENRQCCNPPLSDEEVSSIASSVARYPQGSTAQLRVRRPNVLCLADVQAEEVEWLWEPYIPLRMITLASGDPGVGKTFLSLDLAASLTQGRAMLTGDAVGRRSVLYLTHENSPAHVLRPRFDALGGDPSRFFLLLGTVFDDGTEGRITLGDTEQLEQAITKCDVGLVVIDPLQSFLGSDVDAHRANETRPIMDGLIRLAEKTDCAILITRHLSKGIGGSALYRGMGSIDLTGAARSELLVAQDPEDSSRVIMAHAKSNLGRLGPSLAYSIGEGGVLTWSGESRLKANDLLIPPAGENSALEEAEDFLRESLGRGPRPSKQIQDQAKANGIAPITLRRAQERVGVVKKPSGYGGLWMLELPSLDQNIPDLFMPTG